MVGSRTTAPATVVLPLFQARAKENRLRIIEVLQNCERYVCQFQSPLDLGQSLLSHQLRVLREAGLARSRKEGGRIHDTLPREALEMAGSWISEARDKAEIRATAR